MIQMNSIFDQYQSAIIGTILKVVSSIVVTFFGGIWAEHKYNFISRLKQKYARWRNQRAAINLVLRYEPNEELDFDDLKNIFKNSFINQYPDYRLLSEKKFKFDIFFDEFTVEIMHDNCNEIYIEILKSSCGIQDLREKVGTFLTTLTRLNNENRLFKGFISCNVALDLPYTWSYVKIFEPSGFKLKDYSIKMERSDRYKTGVTIHLNSINASLASTEEISFLLDRFL
jgi:hypothetical protein